MGHVSLVNNFLCPSDSPDLLARHLTPGLSDFGLKWAGTLPDCGVVSSHGSNGTTNLTERIPSTFGLSSFCSWAKFSKTATSLGRTGTHIPCPVEATIEARLYALSSTLHLFRLLMHLKDIRLLERLENGVYKGDFEEVHPSTLAQYCAGVNGSGAQSITSKITKGQEAHIRHPPVEAACSRSPFQSSLELKVFEEALQQATLDDLRPAYLGLDLPYEPAETFYTGRSRKGLTVPLPHDVWFPRILLWCRSIDLITRIKLYP